MGIANILLCLGLWANISALVSAVVTVSAFCCDYNKDIIVNSYCCLIRTKHGTTYLSAGSTFHKTIDDVTFRIGFLRKVNGRYEPFGVTFEVDFCDQTKNENTNYFLKRIFLTAMRTLKTIRCPIHGNYSMPRYRFALPMAQGFMPPADYLLNFYMSGSKPKLHLIDGNISFSVTAVV